MKKHPVDDLFKSKLTNWEKQPSSEAWSRIAGEKKNNERKIGIWVWYAAASILVATTTGYLVWHGNARQSRQIENVIAKTDQPKKLDLPVYEAVAVKDSAFGNKKAPKEGHEDLQEAIAANIKSERSISTVSKEPEKQVEVEIKDAENDRVAVVPIVKEVVLPENAVSVSMKKEALPQIALVSEKSEVKEDNRTIVVNVVTEKETDEKPKASRFTKVFRQLKNVRAGDPVDWQEVGFNPKDIVAKVDDRLRNTEGEISEKYQNIKQKTKL